MSKIPFMGPTYQGRSTNIDASRCVNLYPELSPEDEKTVISLIGTPGTSLFQTISAGMVRGMYQFNNLIYVVSGNSLYSVSSSGVVSASLGTLTTSIGRVQMSDNNLYPSGGNQLMIVDGSTSAYIYNVGTGAFTPLGSGTWAAQVVAPQTVTFIGGYFIVSGTSASFQVSALYDGTTWSGLDVAAKSTGSDKIMSVASCSGLLWVMGHCAPEVWYQTTGHPPFALVPGSPFDYGLAATYSIANSGQNLLWLANQTQGGKGELLGVAMSSGYGGQIISPPSVNWQIKQYSTIMDAFGYCYTDEGHTFYVLTFPTANATWVYDLTTQMWHERSTYVSSPYVIGRHVGNAYASLGNEHFIGDYQNGNIYQMTSNIYKDNGNPIVSMRTAQHLYDGNDLNGEIISRLQIDAETGVGDNTTLNPQTSLSWSDDGGHTFGNEYQASLGPIGATKTRLIWRRLGYSRDRVFRITCSDPVKKVFMNAYLNGKLANS